MFSSKYEKHILLPEIGLTGHNKLRQASILIVGAGGIGIPASIYLNASGIGKIGIIDDDIIEISNLARQFIYSVDDIGQKKSLTLCKKLQLLNPDTICIPYDLRFIKANASQIAKNYQFIINGSDNFATRLLINECAHSLQIPWLDIAVTGFNGQLALYLPNNGCYECVFNNLPAANNSTNNCSTPNCATIGVSSPLCGMFGSWAATIAMNVVCGIMLQKNIFYYFAANKNSLQYFTWKKNKDCQVCSKVNPVNMEQKNYPLNNKLSKKNSFLLTNTDIKAMLNSTQEEIIFLDLTSYSCGKELLQSISTTQNFNIIKLDLTNFFENSDLEKYFIKLLPNKKAKYICICEFAVKSKIAAEILQQENYIGYYVIPK